jgi:membrane associated rhomboid family serine protease
VVTVVLVLLNVAVYFFGPALSHSGLPAGTSASCSRNAFVAHYGAVPKELTENQQLPQTWSRLDAGGDVACPAPSFTKNPAISAFTSLFVHAGPMHLVGNMVMLLVFAGRVEKRLGRAAFTTLYLVSGYTAAYGFAFTQPTDTVPLVGASGAIAGVVGAYLWMYPRNWLMGLAGVLFLVPLPASTTLAGPSSGQVAWVAHVVGFTAGLLLAMGYFGKDLART